MKPINGNIFIERNPMEKELGGVKVSEKACVKNHIGICKYAESYKFVGRTVHVPHYGVMDMDYDGKEYAMCKEERLFAIKEGDNWKPINGYVKVRKCEKDHIRDSAGEIALWMTENHIQNTNWVEVLEIAEDCETMCDRYIGMFCFAPENNDKLARIERSEDFCLHESLIEWVTTGE
jgi:co-chaperonin GroES (HSP10)